MLGILFSVLAAATFALNATAARRAVLTGTVLQGLAVTVPLGVPLFLVLSWALGDLGKLGAMPREAWLYFAAAGIVHFVIGRYGNYRSSSAIGTNLASPILQAEVLVALLLAMILLGEVLTPLRIIGIVLILIGPMVVINREPKPASAGAAVAEQPAASGPVFQPRYAEGYFFASVAAFGYGLSPVLIGLGLKAAPGTAIVGGLVSYAAACALVWVILLLTRQVAASYALDRQTLKWFLVAGSVVFLSQVFRYAAIMFAPVSVVTTLQRLSSLFRIYFGWLINREHEVFDRSVIIATLISLVGAVALSISTELFLSLADWPAWLVAVARWQWP